MKLNKIGVVIALSLVLVFSINSVSQAQVQVVRGGAENPVVTIGKSTLYGAGTGLLLGLALSLVVDEDTGDIMKWSFVGGTFGGFAIGMYHVANRPQPTAAMLQFNSGGLAKVAIPQPQVSFNRGQSFDLKLNLVSLSL